jgi:hypothetical protein
VNGIRRMAEKIERIKFEKENGKTIEEKNKSS